MTIGTMTRVQRWPWNPRVLREVLFCLLGAVTGTVVAAALITLPVWLLALGRLVSGRAPVPFSGSAPNGGGAAAFAAGQLGGLLLVIMFAPRVARVVGAGQRRLAAFLLGAALPAPPPVHRRGRGPVGWLLAGLRDGPGWRAVAYLLVKVPLGIIAGYAAFCWAVGLVNLSYPFWWRLFRNHPPGTSLSPVPVLTPLGAFHVATFPGTFAVFAAGLAMLLAAPWIATGVCTVDRALMRGLLSPGRLAQRVRQLEQSRAQAVDDAAARLRRVERDLHDGAQMRLAALAMNLGRARERLAAATDPTELARARDLVDAAHHSAKDALVELRNLARGIHPPVLDNGLADALTTLAAGSAIPVRLHMGIAVRPTPAIESIAYFCTAELLANAAKHSHAARVRVDVTQHQDDLRLAVTDDGIGGADPAGGTGLAGLAQRAGTVDGHVDIASPPGGPTRITVTLPLRA